MNLFYLLAVCLFMFNGCGSKTDEKKDIPKPAAASVTAVPVVKDYKYYIARAEIHRSKGEYTEAISDDDRALALNPEFKQVYSLRGLAFLMAKKYPEALEDMNHAILDNQDVEENYNNRCYCYDQMGQYDKAIIDCDNAIALSPNVADPYDTRAQVYLHLKNYDKSWADIKKEKQLGGNPSADMVDKLKKESGRTES